MMDITQILNQAKKDPKAADQLMAAIYDELRKLAARKLNREQAGHTLQATALVHEAYLRLVGDKQGDWENSGHFFAAAAEAMRRILVESARRKARLKRGGGRKGRQVDEADAIVMENPIDLIALDEALKKLAIEDEQKAQLVKLRYFAGLTAAQAGEVLGVSLSTADRYWTFAKAWLFNEMSK